MDLCVYSTWVHWASWMYRIILFLIKLGKIQLLLLALSFSAPYSLFLLAHPYISMGIHTFPWNCSFILLLSSLTFHNLYQSNFKFAGSFFCHFKSTGEVPCWIYHIHYCNIIFVSRTFIWFFFYEFHLFIHIFYWWDIIVIPFLTS